MTEVERLRDLALGEILKYVSVGQRREYPDTSQDTMRLAFELQAESAKQHASDQNDVRRSMGLAECGPPDVEKQDTKPTSVCDVCRHDFNLEAECCKVDIRAIKGQKDYAKPVDA